MLSTESVWNRKELVGAEISATQYNLTIGLVLAWGFGVNWAMVTQIDPQVFLSVPSLAFGIAYFASVIAGTMIYQRSDNPVISFVGYNLVVLPLGVLLARFLPFVDPLVIGQAFQATAGVVMIMTAVSTMKPQFFLKLGSTLFVAFIAAFIVEFGFIIFSGRAPAIFDWIFVLIFSGYVGYDWARAQSLPKTLDNAVDCAAALYVDIVILFIRMIQLFSRR
jgi:FtsH-binding integral membrane protein